MKVPVPNRTISLKYSYCSGERVLENPSHHVPPALTFHHASSALPRLPARSPIIRGASRPPALRAQQIGSSSYLRESSPSHAPNFEPENLTSSPPSTGLR